MSNADLIAEARAMAGFARSNRHGQRSHADMIYRLADALEARQPTEDDRNFELEAVLRGEPCRDAAVTSHYRALSGVDGRDITEVVQDSRSATFKVVPDARQPTEDEWCREESCVHRHWRSGGMPTHRRGSDCPERSAVPDAATEAKQPEGWSTEDRQESKQEAERRWSRPVAREAEQRYQSGCINGFMLGAEWQKARETFISYKVIADELRAERDAATEALERVRAIHYPFTPQLCYMNAQGGQSPMTSVHCHNCNPEGSNRVGDPDTWPCPTIAALDGAPEPEWEYGLLNPQAPDGGKLRGGAHLISDSREHVLKQQRRGHPMIQAMRRRKAGPWLPVESEEK